MATFLFMVSISATTLLLLAVAVDEVLSMTRQLLGRWFAAGHSAAVVDLRYEGPQARLSQEPPRTGKAQLGRVAARAELANDEGDWVPDRAA